MSKKQKLNKEDKFLLKRAKKCKDVMIESAQVNGFIPLEALLATEEIFVSLLVQNKATKEGIEKTMDDMKRVIFKELNY